MAENRLPKYKFSTPKKEKTIMDYYKVLPVKKTINDDDNNNLNEENNFSIDLQIKIKISNWIIIL